MSLIKIKSISPKIINQDYISIFKNERLLINGIIVADGLGSHYLAEKGSEYCVLKLKKILEEYDECTIDFNKIYTDILNSLKFEAETNESVGKLEDKSKVLGTTLICIVEFIDKFVISYVGNGSIWHVRGNFTHFSEQRYLPWSAINLLNPHTVEENGKEALYKYFSYESSEDNVIPTTFEISKDNKLYGDIFIVSTDGLDSIDHTPVAKDKEGGLWISGEPKMELLYKKLKSVLIKKSFDIIDIELESFCNEVKERKMMDDDISFGIIITEQVLNYHRQLNEDNSSI